jgi:hypothetical protein
MFLARLASKFAKSAYTVQYNPPPPPKKKIVHYNFIWASKNATFDAVFESIEKVWEKLLKKLWA